MYIDMNKMVAGKNICTLLEVPNTVLYTVYDRRDLLDLYVTCNKGII